MSGAAKGVGKLAKASVGILTGALDLASDIISPDINIPPPPKIPSPPEETPMPIPDDKAIQAGQRRAYQRRRATSGRASTILTGGEGSLG